MKSGSQFNHDINVAADFAAEYPQISWLLRNEPLIELFTDEDKKACTYKAQFLRIGITSLVCATLSLIGLAIQIAAQNASILLSQSFTILTDALGLLAIVLLLIDRVLLKSKQHYLQSCFMRERIRQWRFQLFLDGEFICNGSQRDLDSRLKQFVEAHHNLHGELAAFLRTPSCSDSLMHKPTSYSDSTVFGQVLSAIDLLRFRHQLSYSEGKLHDVIADGSVSLTETYHWAETLARFSLIAAVSIPAMQVTLLCLNALQFLLPHMPGIALLFIALSASARAFRTGLSLPEEMESSHCANIDETVASRFITVLGGEVSDEQERAGWPYARPRD